MNAYLKYYNSAFWLEDKLLSETDLIRQNDVANKRIFNESTFPYPSEICRKSVF